MPQCPYYQRAKKNSGYPVHGYCGGYRSGKLRVPTVEEMREFCACDWHCCPVFRFRSSEEGRVKNNSNVA
jgi:hypothetical protein